MTKNTSGGSGHKRRSHASAVQPVKDIKDLAKAEGGGEVYGKIVRALGNRRFEVSCQMPDGSKKEINCSIRGSFKKLVVKDDYVLVQLFDFNDRQAIILTSYTTDDVFKLRRAKLWDYTESGGNDNDDEFTRLVVPQPTGRSKVKAESSRSDVQVQKFFSDDESDKEEDWLADEQPTAVKQSPPPIPSSSSVPLSSYDIDCI